MKQKKYIKRNILGSRHRKPNYLKTSVGLMTTAVGLTAIGAGLSAINK